MVRKKKETKKRATASKQPKSARAVLDSAYWKRMMKRVKLS